MKVILVVQFKREGHTGRVQTFRVPFIFFHLIQIIMFFEFPNATVAIEHITMVQDNPEDDSLLVWLVDGSQLVVKGYNRRRFEQDMNRVARELQFGLRS